MYNADTVAIAIAIVMSKIIAKNRNIGKSITQKAPINDAIISLNVLLLS